MAYLDEKELDKALQTEFKRYTINTVTDKEELVNTLKVYKEAGLGFDNEEYSMGLRCVAAPIFNYEGKAVYSVSISGPTVRMTEDKMKEQTKALKEAAAIISKKIGYKE